ncbi:MAG: hypothetical protein ACHQNA_04445 [Acidimicrobiales bacterium]
MTDRNMVDAVRDALAEEMERDPTVVLLGQDVGAKGVDVARELALY